MADVEDDDILSQAAIEEAVNGADGLEEPEQEEEGDIEEEEEDEEAAAADDTMAAAMGTDLTAQYVQAKSIPTLSRKPPGRSGVWECYYSVDIPDLEHLENLQPLDDSAYQKIHQGILSGKQYVACRACLEDTSKSLSKCLFRPTYKKCGSGGFDGTGNPGKHLRGQHLPMYQAITKERGAFRYDAFANRSVAAVAVGPMAAPPVPQEVPQQHSSTISHSTLSEPGSMVHEMSREAGKSQALAIFQEKQHRYATNNNIPLRVLTDHKACPEFRDMMIYAMQNGAALLKCPNNGLMGRMAHTNYRAKDYQTFMAAVGMHLGETDQYYMKTFGCHKSFLTVAHDVWDSNKKEILGVTIFFYNPKRGVYLRIPVALAESKDKKGEPTTNQIMDILKAFGIEDRMIYKAMNDTTNTALLVGRNLSGENAYCAMHEIQLAFSHATGQRKRYKDKVVVDEFDACQAIRKQAEETAKWLANKKSKGRWKKFTDTLSAAGRIPRAFCMSNHTRAGGEALFYASFIQARWNLHHYCIVDDTCPEVEDSKYHVMAQTLAVEFPMLKLVCFVQSDHYGANSYTAYGTYRVFASYCYSKVVWVPETRRSKATNDTEKWNGTASWYPTKFDGSPQFDEPKEDAEGLYLPSTTERIGLRTIKVAKLHKIPQKLFQRIPSELRRYGACVSSSKQDDKLLAMMCNPFGKTHMLDDFETLATVVDGSDTLPANKLMGKGVRQRATTILTIWVKQMWGNKFDLAEQATANASPKKPQAKPRTNDPLALAREAKRRRTEDTPVEEGVDPIQKAIDKWLGEDFNLLDALRAQKRKPIGKDVLSTLGNEEHCWLDNIEVVKIYFDLQEWWETTGKTNHPIIYEIAVRIFAMPDSNGFQERVFSSCTWFDGKLSNGQKVDMTFQMRLLCYKNSAFIQNYKQCLNDARKEWAKNRTKALLKLTASRCEEEDYDSDIDAMVDLYNKIDEPPAQN